MKEAMYENQNYLIEQDLAYSYITNKKTYRTEKYFWEDKNLIEKYIEIIKASNNQDWVDDSFKAFIIEQIEISEEVDREIEERKKKQRH